MMPAAALSQVQQRAGQPLWLRGLDLNQRPLGYEYKTAMTGNPLILQERRSAASGSTLSDGASFFVSFHPVSGCYGSKMGAEIRAQSPRQSAASDAGDLATAILAQYVPYAHDHLCCFGSLLRKPLRDPHSHERLIRNTLPLCDQLGTLDLLRLQSERDGFLLSRTFSDSPS